MKIERVQVPLRESVPWFRLGTILNWSFFVHPQFVKLQNKKQLH